MLILIVEGLTGICAMNDVLLHIGVLKKSKYAQANIVFTQ